MRNNTQPCIHLLLFKSAFINPVIIFKGSTITSWSEICKMSPMEVGDKKHFFCLQ